MKFNYELYRPNKLIQDVYTPDKSYYDAKDVQVSPLTKIGDVAAMPQPAGKRVRRQARMLIQKLAPTLVSKAHKRAIPVRIADEVTMPRRYALGKGIESSFSLWKFVVSMKYALLGIVLLGGGIGFMVANLHSSDTVKSASDKSNGTVEATGSSHTTSMQKPKAHAVQTQNAPTTTPQPSAPQDTTNSPVSSPAPSYSSTLAPSYLQTTPSSVPKPVTTPSPATQPTPPSTATTQPTTTPASQPTPQPPTPTSSPSGTPTTGQSSSSTSPTTSPSTGSTTPPPSTSPSNTPTTTVTTPQSPSSTP